MKLSELKAQAQKIIDLANAVTENNTETFLVKSGGIPFDEVGVKEFIVFQSNDKKYKTQMNGYAYESETIVRCTKTEVKDSQNREIYLLPNEVTFVWEYRAGNAMNFDSGCFESPDLKFS
jgi:delta-aminolevulinic acid dehydratase/porphobilinogen synthase